MDKNIINSAKDKKFTEFSDAVKTELKTKLAGNETVSQYTSDFEKIQQMKTMFSKINTDFGDEPTSDNVDEPNTDIDEPGAE